MKWNNLSVVSVCLLNLIYHIGTGLAHKCYVCGPDSGKYEDDLELKRNFPDSKIPLCSTYVPKMRDAFIRDCPTNMKGCLTKIEAGGSIMRNCAPIGIDDCKVANGVTYCYCSSDKCNTPDRRLSDPSPRQATPPPSDDLKQPHGAPHAQSQMSPPDDEDNEEGSAGWASFYYDNYYDEQYDLGEYPRGYHDDTVDGDDPGDYADVTEPPHFIQEELDRETQMINKDKNRDKLNNKDNNDIVFDGDEDYKRRPGGGNSGAEGLFSLSAAATLSLSLLAARL